MKHGRFYGKHFVPSISHSGHGTNNASNESEEVSVGSSSIQAFQNRDRRGLKTYLPLDELGSGQSASWMYFHDKMASVAEQQRLCRR